MELSEFISISGLKEMGWTDSAIKKYLGEPDKTAPNPRYKSAPPTKLYARERVTGAMASPEWRQWNEGSLARRKKQRETSLATAERLRKECIDEMLSKLEFGYPDVDSYQTLANMAKKHWKQQKQDFNIDRGNFDSHVCSDDADPMTIDRWIHNMLRHEFCNYDAVLSELTGRIGKDAAYNAIYSRVTDHYKNWIHRTFFANKQTSAT